MKVFTLILITASLLSISFSTDSKKFSKLKSYVFVPSGTTEVNDAQVSCNAFYMSSTEVTNASYRHFLSELLKNGDQEKYEKALPDTCQWEVAFQNAFLEPMATQYFNHPAYDNYPVVNVSKEGAELYCEWLTADMRKRFPKDQFNDFRLPTKTEWTYAARGGLENSPFPWGGPSTRDTKGCLLANYIEIGDQNIRRAEDGSFEIVSPEDMKISSFSEYRLLAPAQTYRPNGYGLYNMSGNCAELISNSNVVMGGSWRSAGADIKVNSEAAFTQANPTVGFRPVMSFVKTD